MLEEWKPLEMKSYGLLFILLQKHSNILLPKLIKVLPTVERRIKLSLSLHI
jgi:hypothetical protein